MARGKKLGLSNREKKRIKDGSMAISNETSIGKARFDRGGWGASHGPAGRASSFDTRRPAKSNESSILHAVLFCVLVVIVGAWAIGY